MDRCTVVVRSTHGAPIKSTPIRVGIRTPDLATNVSISVWFPSSTSLELGDKTLNKVLPRNAANPPAGCTDVYQTTPIRAYTNWANGGSTLEDVVVGTDITDMAAFRSLDPSGAQVTGGYVKVRLLRLEWVCLSDS